jgi:hypothetical protein
VSVQPICRGPEERGLAPIHSGLRRLRCCAKGGSIVDTGDSSSRAPPPQLIVTHVQHAHALRIVHSTPAALCTKERREGTSHCIELPGRRWPSLFVIAGGAVCDYSGMFAFRRIASAVLSLAALSTCAVRAGAEAAVALVYEAAEDCPSQAQFEAAVRERGGDFDLPPSDVVGSALHVALHGDGAGFAGSLELQGVAPAAGRREVHAAGCEEAMQGIAVIAALLLRRHESAVSESAPSSGARLPPSTPAPSSRLINMGTIGADSVAVGAGTLTFDSSLTYSLTGGVEVGLIPSVALPRYDFTSSTASIVTTPEANRYLASGGVLRARWTLLGGGTYQFGDHSTQLIGGKAAFGTCFSLWYDLDGLVLLACGETAAGLMRLETKDAAGAKVQSKTVALGSVGAEVDLQYRIGSLFHLALKAGVDAAFTGNLTAERADGSELFQSSPLSLHVAGGFGLHF